MLQLSFVNKIFQVKKKNYVAWTRQKKVSSAYHIYRVRPGQVRNKPGMSQTWDSKKIKTGFLHLDNY